MSEKKYRLRLQKEGGATCWLVLSTGRGVYTTCDPFAAYIASEASIKAVRKLVLRRAEYAAKEVIVEEAS